jgi:hypothetical protein
MTAQNSFKNKDSKGGKKGAPKDRQQSNPRPRAARKSIDTTELRAWLDSQGFPVNVAIKVNGTNHPTAVITVDFGSPVVPVRLSDDQRDNIAYWIKDLTMALYTTPVNVRVTHDPQNGILYTSVTA